MDSQTAESIQALNRRLEEYIVETVNHRLLYSFVENDLDVDQLNNHWCMQAVAAKNFSCREGAQEKTSGLHVVEVMATSPKSTPSNQSDLAAFKVPPRPPKNVQQNEDERKNQATITERSRDFNSILNEFASHGENSAPMPIGRTPECGSKGPVLPPRPPKPIPNSDRVEPVSVRTNNQPPRKIANEKSPKKKSYTPNFALAILNNIKASSLPSRPPTVPKRDFVDVQDTRKNVSDDDSDHIYEPLRLHEPTSVTSNLVPDIVTREVDARSTHFPSRKEKYVPAVFNHHETNAKLLNEELMRNRNINEKGGTFYSLLVPNPALVPKDTDAWENSFYDDSSLQGSVEESNSTMDCAVVVLKPSNESSIELMHQKTSKNGMQSPVGSQNADCGPDKEAHYDVVTHTIYDIAENACFDPVVKSPSGAAEKKHGDCVEVYYDTPEKVYYTLAEKSENDLTTKSKKKPVVKSQNGPVEKRLGIGLEEVYYDTPGKVYYDIAANSENERIAKSQNDQVEKKHNNGVHEVYFDQVGSLQNKAASTSQNGLVQPYGYIEEIYCDPSEKIYLDPVEYWETSSTASYPCSWLAEEPLYQLTENYENLGRQDPKGEHFYESGGIYNFRPAPKELEQIHSRKVNGRTLWCNVEYVISANVLNGLSRREKDLQEAKFEIYTTEFSFMKSLKILKKHFITSSEFSNEKILSNDDRAELFMYIKPLMARSKAFLRDLDECWKKSIFLHGIFDVICKHACKNFDVYITYCSYLNDTIEKLNSLCASKNFLATLKRLEQSEGCSKLPLLSFLTVPMERITSLDLLIKKALSLLVKENKALNTRQCDTDHDSCLLASDYVKKVCEKSNAACNTKRRIKSLIQLERKLEYPGNMSPLSLISEKRWLIMFGDVTKHDWVENLKNPGTISRSVSSVGSFIKPVFTIFLCNDYVILTRKKKSDGSSFLVVDYCQRDFAKMVLPRTSHTTNSKLLVDSNKQYKMLLVMDENHEKKKVEILLSCSLERERDLWLKTISGERKERVRPKEKLMLYVCIYPFTSDEESQLSLEKGDEVTVTKKLEYGWFEGIRSRDKKTGAFPPSRVQLIATEVPNAAPRTFFELYTV